jgi:hypothetical protein
MYIVGSIRFVAATSDSLPVACPWSVVLSGYFRLLPPLKLVANMSIQEWKIPNFVM